MPELIKRQVDWDTEFMYQTDVEDEELYRELELNSWKQFTYFQATTQEQAATRIQESLEQID